MSTLKTYKVVASYMGRKISFTVESVSLADALKDGETTAKTTFREAGYLLLAWANESKIDVIEVKTKNVDDDTLDKFCDGILSGVIVNKITDRLTKTSR